MKMTYQPKTRQRSKEHGFMKRMKTRAGRNVLKARRSKGRKKLKPLGKAFQRTTRCLAQIKHPREKFYNTTQDVVEQSLTIFLD